MKYTLKSYIIKYIIEDTSQDTWKDTLNKTFKDILKVTLKATLKATIKDNIKDTLNDTLEIAWKDTLKKHQSTCKGRQNRGSIYLPSVSPMSWPMVLNGLTLWLTPRQANVN